MNIRAVIFDVYGTLLEVGLPPPDAEACWHGLFHDLLDIEPPVSRLDCSVAANQVITRHHEAARARGIPWPEVHWPSVMAEVVPELVRLPAAEREDFLFRQMQAGHTTAMTAGTAALLAWLKQRQYRLGIASNAQAYTLRELRNALATHALGLDLFESDLCFWSFEYGFSKPDPHVFRILTARLEARGIRPPETLMIGDRLENDIAPARAQGWRTWQLGAGGDGDWPALRNWLLTAHPEVAS